MSAYTKAFGYGFHISARVVSPTSFHFVADVSATPPDNGTPPPSTDSTNWNICQGRVFPLYRPAVCGTNVCLSMPAQAPARPKAVRSKQKPPCSLSPFSEDKRVHNGRIHIQYGGQSNRAPFLYGYESFGMIAIRSAKAGRKPAPQAFQPGHSANTAAQRSEGTGICIFGFL
jgi:hypothetical protein